MAGAVKHMERSHRSYATRHQGVFNYFHRNAYKVANLKESRKTLGQRLAGMFKKVMPSTTSK